MSIPKHQRDESDLLALTKAVELEAKTAKLCKKLPRSWSFVRTRYITDNANSIIENISCGNIIYVTSAGDYAQRRRHFIAAHALCDVLQKKIDYIEKEKPAKSVPLRDENGEYILNKNGKKIYEEQRCFTDHQIMEWSRLTSEVARLVRGLIESDRKRFRTFHSALTLQNDVAALQESVAALPHSIAALQQSADELKNSIATLNIKEYCSLCAFGLRGKDDI